MIKVYSDKFCWSKTSEGGTLMAKLEMGDFAAVRKVMIRKNDIKHYLITVAKRFLWYSLVDLTKVASFCWIK